jgi:hypothetical protein
LSGDNAETPAIKLEFTMNALDDPSITKTAKVKFTMEEFLVEYCNEIFSNIYNVLMEYKSLFWFNSL